MYEDTILPVRNKVRIPSRTRVKLYFVQEQTNKSLVFLKWIEMVICLLCLCFAILALNPTDLSNLTKIVITISNTFGVLVVLVEITYPYFERPLPLMVQILGAGINFTTYSMLTILIYQTKNSHDLLKALLFLDGFTTVLFLIDFICKIIISTYLHQTTRVKSVVDVGVSAFLPPLSPPHGKPRPHRSVLTTTPITYGGTFPIGKNEPPFLPEERSPMEGCNTPEKGTRHRSVQTPHFGDSKAIGGPTFDFGPSAMDRLIARSKMVDTYIGYEEKGTSTVAPFYLQEERRRKSPWTCSTPTTSRKIEARKQASMSTPITYSGTFAVNKELVPITLGGLTLSSPHTSPRTKKASSRSESNSPRKPETVFVNVERLDQISEEKISLQTSSEDCSLTRSNCAITSASALPGTVLDDYGSKRKMQYDLT